MANRWTPAQQEALDTRNKNLLLSAAAGSGKTAVLTERITRIAGDMESGIDINELLVLTFTKAAAAEMKSRVSASLTNKLREADAENNLPLIHHLERQLSLMGSAQISTLDSFFQSLLRQYFYLLDLDPKTQIMADENEGYLLKEAVLAEVLERWYEEADPDFLKTADLFASRYQVPRPEGYDPAHPQLLLLDAIPDRLAQASARSLQHPRWYEAGRHSLEL